MTAPVALPAAPAAADPGAVTVVRRLALLGGESSGKTTLAIALARALGSAWVHEIGREVWEALRRTLTVQELLDVGRRQVALEDAAAVRLMTDAASGLPPAPGGRRPAPAPVRWLICDTTALTTLQYCLHDHGHAPPELHRLAARAYDLTVVCEPDFHFVQDGCRRDDGWRLAQHRWTVQRLAMAGVEPLHVTGAVDERVAQVLARLTAMAPGLPRPPQLGLPTDLPRSVSR